MINNRQGGNGGGRRRGRGGNGSGGGGGNGGGGQRGPQSNGSRIDSRARGNASQLHEKYKNMASDAQRAGDRVSTEYYLQFADHYFRVLSEQRGRFEDQQQPRRSQSDFDEDGDEEFGDEGSPTRGREQWNDGPPAEPVRADRDDGRDGGRDVPRRREGGEDRVRDAQRDGQRDSQRDGQRDGGTDNARREWRDRPERVRAEAPIAGQHRAEPIAAGESVEGRAAEVLEADRPLDPPMSRRRGRSRREELGEAPTQPIFESAGFEPDRLPPALTPTLAANDADAPAKPRRRRVRVEGAETSAAE